MSRRGATDPRRIARAAVAVIVVAALVVFLFRVQWGQTWSAIRGASPAVLALAAAVNLISLAMKGVRWWLFLRATGAPSLGLALRATFAGAALNNVLIANAGEAGRVLLVARSSGVSTDRVLATLALERLFELAGYVVLFLVAVSVVDLPAALDDMRPFVAIAAALLVGGLLYLTLHPQRATVPAARRAGVVQRVLEYSRGFSAAMRSASTAKRFSEAMLLSIAAWALQVATYQLTARAAHFPISVAGTVAAILAVNLGFAVRVTPGNVGVFQAVYAMTAAAFGLDADVAVGVGLLIQTQQILPVTLIGLLAAPRGLRVSAASRSAAGAA